MNALCPFPVQTWRGLFHYSTAGKRSFEVRLKCFQIFSPHATAKPREAVIFVSKFHAVCAVLGLRIPFFSTKHFT